jgi:hypothetical protein
MNTSCWNIRAQNHDGAGRPALADLSIPLAVNNEIVVQHPAAINTRCALLHSDSAALASCRVEHGAAVSQFRARLVRPALLPHQDLRTRIPIYPGPPTA